ncbi:MAG: response regulator transcription factor [Pseudomonadota bacterium]
MNDTSETVLIIDDHPVVLDGLALLLRDIFDSVEVLTASHAEAAMECVLHRPDIDWIFLDIHLPGISGFELLKQFSAKKITASVIVMSSECDPPLIDQSLKYNARGVLSKVSGKAIFSECVKTVEQGRIFLVSEHAQQLKRYRESVLVEKQLIEEGISKRQREALLLIARGYTNKEISTSMSVTESTVKSHVSSLMNLFDADNRTHCVAEARRLGMLE